MCRRRMRTKGRSCRSLRWKRQKGVKEMTKTAKFFIICGAVCVLGIILTAAGYAMGGVQDMEKVEQSHEWFNVGSANKVTDTVETAEYDSIKADGNMDIAVIGQGFTRDMVADFAKEWLADNYDAELAGSVIVRWKEGTAKPEVKVEKGVLIIESGGADPDFEVNLSEEDSCVDVIVFCRTKTLDSIEISTGFGDTAVGGVECKSMNISSGAGDIEMDSAKADKMVLGAKAGDIGFTNCEGNISAEVDSGDIEFDSALAMDQFAGSLHTESGDVQVNDSDDEVKDFSFEGGPNKLTLKTKAGDIEADFTEAGHPLE